MRPHNMLTWPQKDRNPMQVEVCENLNRDFHWNLSQVANNAYIYLHVRGRGSKKFEN